MFEFKDLMQFFRREPGGFITQRDIDLSGDVYSLQPILFFLAYSIRAKNIIEIGVADGSTSVPLVMAAKENDGLVYSVDPAGCGDAKRLMKDFEAEKWWRFCNMKSDNFFAEVFKDQQVDFAFIDGDHAFPQVARDVENCCSRLGPGGIVFVSDFHTSKGPDHWVKPEIYTQETNYDTQCQNGIFKGLNLVTDKFPDLSCITLRDRQNPSVIIAKNYRKVGG